MVCAAGTAGWQILRPTGAGRQLILMMKWAGYKKHTAYSIYSFVFPLLRETVSIMGTKGTARRMVN